MRSNPSTVTDLSAQVAQTVRELNHLTRHHDAVPGPTELCWLLADLATTAHRLPQLFRQLAVWLQKEHAGGRLRGDTGTRPSRLITAATIALAEAERRAGRLAETLDTAHESVAHLAINDRPQV